MTVRRLTDDVVAAGRAAGLDAVGVTTAEVFAPELEVLRARRAAGLHAGMQFTYRNPERSTDPTRALPSARSMVVGALSYAERDDGAIPPVPGRVARYAWRDRYGELRSMLGAIADRLGAAGWRGVVLADDNALVDRAAAVRAGIGWYGKNANVLVPGRGSWFVLGAVLTDAELVADEPLADGCGTCRRCLDDGCPTDAIVAPGVIDARRCLAWSVQADGVIPRWQRVALGDRIYGCDDCQEVCPPSRVELRGAPSAPHDAQPVVDVVAMVTADDDTLLADYGRWYVPRREPRYLRRNALVVIGNVATPGTPGVADAVTSALAEGDEIVAAHAVWAARRLGLDEALAALPESARRSPLVAEELAATVEVRPDLTTGAAGGADRAVGEGPRR